MEDLVGVCRTKSVRQERLYCVFLSIKLPQSLTATPAPFFTGSSYTKANQETPKRDTATPNPCDSILARTQHPCFFYHNQARTHTKPRKTIPTHNTNTYTPSSRKTVRTHKPTPSTQTNPRDSILATPTLQHTSTINTLTHTHDTAASWPSSCGGRRDAPRCPWQSRGAPCARGRWRAQSRLGCGP